MTNFLSLIIRQMKRVKSYIKKQKSSNNIMIRFFILSLIFLWNIIKTILCFCFNAEYRSILFLQLLHAKEVHQTTSLTCMNRYPEIFKACRDYFNNKKELTLLSYGCSTGEEVLTLRQYFPQANIIGADINKHSLARCKKLMVDDKVTFIYSKKSELLKYGKYDAIFCMAVLQIKPHFVRSNGITNLKKIYPFEKFEQTVNELDRLINKDGLLVIHFTQYSVADTNIAFAYETVGDYNQEEYIGPVFDKGSNIIENPIPFKSIYKKL